MITEKLRRIAQERAVQRASGFTQFSARSLTYRETRRLSGELVKSSTVWSARRCLRYRPSRLDARH